MKLNTFNKKAVSLYFLLYLYTINKLKMLFIIIFIEGLLNTK